MIRRRTHYQGLKPSIRAGWLGFLYRLHGSPDMLHSTGPLLSIDVGERTTVETDITEVQERYIGGRAWRRGSRTSESRSMRIRSAREPRRVHHRTDAGVPDEFYRADELHRALAADGRAPVIERRRLRVAPPRGDGVRSDRACGCKRRLGHRPRARRRCRVRSRTGPRGSDRLGDDRLFGGRTRHLQRPDSGDRAGGRERSPIRVDHDDRGARVRSRRAGRRPRSEERQGRHVRR